MYGAAKSLLKHYYRLFIKPLHRCLGLSTFRLLPYALSALVNVEGVAIVQEATTGTACITQNLRAKTSVLSRTVSK